MYTWDYKLFIKKLSKSCILLSEPWYDVMWYSERSNLWIYTKGAMLLKTKIIFKLVSAITITHSTMGHRFKLRILLLLQHELVFLAQAEPFSFPEDHNYN